MTAEVLPSIAISRKTYANLSRVRFAEHVKCIPVLIF